MRSIFFLDEIHRFNKAQQDLLLPEVEQGIITLIGATTENPFFSINAALLSRSQVFTFESLTRDHLRTLILRALADGERGLGKTAVNLHPDALEFLAELSDGDARKALTALEIGVKSSTATPVEFTLELAQDSIQRKIQNFDPTGDSHYDLASAFIKSIRGSDPDAAIYWLARMLEGGEDPRFICRRLVIFASEDVGNADPRGLMVAVAAMQACELVGLPECQLNLSQAVLYLACAPKSNASTIAIGKAREDVRGGRTLPVPVPKHLRDSHYAGAETLGHGVGYRYSHDYADGASDQQYMAEERVYFEPVNRGHEAVIKKWLDERRKKRKEEPGVQSS